MSLGSESFFPYREEELLPDSELVVGYFAVWQSAKISSMFFLVQDHFSINLVLHANRLE